MIKVTFPRSFIKDNLSTMGLQMLCNLKGFILLPILVKSLGTTAYGIYVLVITTLGFIFGISSWGVGFRSRRYLPAAQGMEERRKLFYPPCFFQMISCLVLTMILIAALSLWNNEFTNSGLVLWLFPLYSLITVIYSHLTDYFRYTDRLIYYNYGTAALPYVMIGLILLYLYFGGALSVNDLLIIEIIAMVFISLPLFLRMYREIRCHWYFYRWKPFWEDLKLGFPLIPSYVIDFILSLSDRYVIAALISVKAVGFYNPAYTLGSLIAFIPKVFCAVLAPFLSKAVDEGKIEQAQAMLNYSLRWFLLLAIPFIVGCVVLEDQLLTLLASKEIAMQSAYVAPIVGLGILFYGLTLILSNIFFVHLKTNLLLKINLLAALLNMALNIIFIYFFKMIIVAAVTTLVSYLIVFIYAYRVASRYWTIDLKGAGVNKIILASVFMALMMKFFEQYMSMSQYHIAFLMGEILLGIVGYIFVFVLIKGIDKNELTYLRSLSPSSNFNKECH